MGYLYFEIVIVGREFLGFIQTFLYATPEAHILCKYRRKKTITRSGGVTPPYPTHLPYGMPALPLDRGKQRNITYCAFRVIPPAFWGRETRPLPRGLSGIEGKYRLCQRKYSCLNDPYLPVGSKQASTASHCQLCRLIAVSKEPWQSFLYYCTRPITPFAF